MRNIIDAINFMQEIEQVHSPTPARLIGGMGTGYRVLTDEELLLRDLALDISETISKKNAMPVKVPNEKAKETSLLPKIEKVIFNAPATVVIWADGTKTVVKAGDYDIFDEEKGLAMAIAKKALGNQGNYYEVFKKWLPDEDDSTTDSGIFPDYFTKLRTAFRFPKISESVIEEVKRFEEEERMKEHDDNR